MNIFRCKICEFVRENIFTKYGENERDSLKLLTKISLNLVFLGGITKFGDEFVTFESSSLGLIYAFVLTDSIFQKAWEEKVNQKGGAPPSHPLTGFFRDWSSWNLP